jgi:RecA/RadA recombinase
MTTGQLTGATGGSALILAASVMYAWHRANKPAPQTVEAERADTIEKAAHAPQSPPSTVQHLDWQDEHAQGFALDIWSDEAVNAAMRRQQGRIA